MNCPLCDAAEYKKIFEIKRPELGEGISYHIRSCKTCTFIYAEGLVTEDILLKIYNKNFYASSQQYAPIDKQGDFTAESLQFPIVINAIARTDFLQTLGAKGSLLDIGAARGYFVKAASKVFEAEGIELSPDAAAFGNSMKVKITAGNFLTHDFGKQTFDVITLWDVLACLPQPNAAMTKISSLLKPGGLLVMTLPDGESLTARLLGSYWPMMIPPINWGFYTSDSIKKLLTAHGFTVKQISHEAKWVSIDFVIRKLFRSLHLGDLAQVKLPINPAWRIPLNLGDIMTVAAERDGVA
jgi:SAM-dependent methyltransferase